MSGPEEENDSLPIPTPKELQNQKPEKKVKHSYLLSKSSPPSSQAFHNQIQR
jgi:hypothetical protein